MAVAWHFSKWPLIPMTPTPPNLTFKVAFVERIQNMSFGPHVKPWPWQAFYHMGHFWLREVWGEEFRAISSASTMPLVQVTKAPFAPIMFCMFRSSVVFCNMAKFAQSLKDAHVFLLVATSLFGSWASISPQKKKYEGPMPAKHWKECLVLVQKGMAGLSRAITNYPSRWCSLSSNQVHWEKKTSRSFQEFSP